MSSISDYKCSNIKSRLEAGWNDRFEIMVSDAIESMTFVLTRIMGELSDSVALDLESQLEILRTTMIRKKHSISQISSASKALNDLIQKVDATKHKKTNAKSVKSALQNAFTNTNYTVYETIMSFEMSQNIFVNLKDFLENNEFLTLILKKYNVWKDREIILFATKTHLVFLMFENNTRVHNKKGGKDGNLLSYRMFSSRTKKFCDEIVRPLLKDGIDSPRHSKYSQLKSLEDSIFSNKKDKKNERFIRSHIRIKLQELRDNAINKLIGLNTLSVPCDRSKSNLTQATSNNVNACGIRQREYDEPPAAKRQRTEVNNGSNLSHDHFDSNSCNFNIINTNNNNNINYSNNSYNTFGTMYSNSNGRFYELATIGNDSDNFGRLNMTQYNNYNNNFNINSNYYNVNNNFSNDPIQSLQSGYVFVNSPLTTIASSFELEQEGIIRNVNENGIGNEIGLGATSWDTLESGGMSGYQCDSVCDISVCNSSNASPILNQNDSQSISSLKNEPNLFQTMRFNENDIENGIENGIENEFLNEMGLPAALPPSLPNVLSASNSVTQFRLNTEFQPFSMPHNLGLHESQMNTMESYASHSLSLNMNGFEPGFYTNPSIYTNINTNTNANTYTNTNTNTNTNTIQNF